MVTIFFRQFCHVFRFALDSQCEYLIVALTENIDIDQFPFVCYKSSTNDEHSVTIGGDGFS